MRKDYRGQVRLLAEWWMEAEFKFGISPGLLFHAIKQAAKSDRGLMCKQLREELMEAELEPFLNALQGYKKAQAERKRHGMN